mgnify:CR=1 FL=1
MVPCQVLTLLGFRENLLKVTHSFVVGNGFASSFSSGGQFSGGLSTQGSTGFQSASGGSDGIQLSSNGPSAGSIQGCWGPSCGGAVQSSDSTGAVSSQGKRLTQKICTSSG